MKDCRKCGIKKRPQDFYADENTCKECRRKMVRENRAKKADYYNQRDKERNKKPHRVLARKEYLISERGRARSAEATRRWEKKNPAKRLAHLALNNAVRDGKVDKPSACANCKSGGRLHGHHTDYSKPLEVVWLCPACHTLEHKNLERREQRR